MTPDAPAPRRLHADVWIALAILVFCAVVFAITLTFDSLPAALIQGMGPAAFPQLLLLVMAGLALALAWSSRGRPDEVRPAIPWIVYATAAAFFAAMGVIWLVGMIGLAFVAVVAIGRLWGERRWGMLIASGLFMMATVYLLFIKAFGLQLSRGVLFERWV